MVGVAPAPRGRGGRERPGGVGGCAGSAGQEGGACSALCPGWLPGYPVAQPWHMALLSQAGQPGPGPRALEQWEGSPFHRGPVPISNVQWFLLVHSEGTRGRETCVSRPPSRGELEGAYWVLQTRRLL